MVAFGNLFIYHGVTIKKEEIMMARYIESKGGLQTLLKRMENLKGTDKFEDFEYWVKVVKGCLDEDLAMDEIDYDNAPSWFRPLWTGLK